MSWAAAEIRSKLGHTTGRFPLERIHEVLPIRVMRLEGVDKVIVWNSTSGAVVAVDAALGERESRFLAAIGVGASVLYLGWLTYDSLIDVPAQPGELRGCAWTEAFAGELLASAEAVKAACVCFPDVEEDCPSVLAEALDIPLALAAGRLAKLAA